MKIRGFEILIFQSFLTCCWPWWWSSVAGIEEEKSLNHGHWGKKGGGVLRMESVQKREKERKERDWRKWTWEIGHRIMKGKKQSQNAAALHAHTLSLSVGCCWCGCYYNCGLPSQSTLMPFLPSSQQGPPPPLPQTILVVCIHSTSTTPLYFVAQFLLLFLCAAF